MNRLDTLPVQAEAILFIAQLGFLFMSMIVSVLKGRGIGVARIVTAALALAAALASATVRTVGAGRLPFASMYEFGLLLCIALDGLLVFMTLRYEERAFSLSASIAAFVFGSIMLFFFQKARPLAPALKSAWLGAHVATAVIAYGCLSLSAALALAGFVSAKSGTDRVSRIETLVNRLIVAAFPFLTLLIITGAIWAEYAWGSFWRWDPKETWALVTWLAYLGYLHLTRSRGWKERKAFALAIAAFALVLFTFFGVNFLLPGLHSYMR
jgi:ABC-type transport system involved in cytochrome c biogenesis permease subunit